MRATSSARGGPGPGEPRNPARGAVDADPARRAAHLPARPEDRALADRCSRLVRFLRELSLARTPCVRDVERYPTTLWLADLPEQIPVRTRAGPGDVVLSLPPAQIDPSPELPAVLTGWVRLADRDDSGLTAPPLRESGPLPAPPDGRPPSGEAQEDLCDLPEVSRETVPQVVRAYEEWLPVWQQWAVEDRERAAHHRCYEALHTAHQRLSQEGDCLELVLATGLLCLRTTEGERIRHPLLTTGVHLEVDRTDGTIGLRLPEDALTCLEDAALLQGCRGYRADRVRTLHERLRSQRTEPLGPGTGRVLSSWMRSALEAPRGYHGSWAPTGQVTGTPRVDLAPVVLLRRRGRGALLEHYDAMLRSLALPGRPPSGLARLVESPDAEPPRARSRDRHPDGPAARPGNGPGRPAEPEPLFCLPTNAEQARILDCLQHERGVVVEGPPGTGKTHTIANLVCALLAQGQRVLVTSQKAQALRVLHEKLPPQMRRLCVGLTDVSRNGSAQLAGSVASLAAERAIHHAPTRAAQIRRVEAARHRALQRRSLLGEQLRALREAQNYEHPRVADDYGGTLPRIAELLSLRRAEDGWLYELGPRSTRPQDRVPSDEHPPLSEDEALELLDLLREGRHGEGTGEGACAADPDLPPPADLEDLLSVERQRLAEADACEPPGTMGLGASGASDLRELLSALQDLDDAAARTPPVADPSDWRARAVLDAAEGRNTTLWDLLARQAHRVAEAVEALDGVGLHVVELPGNAGGADGGPGDAPRAHEDLLALHGHATHLAQGGTGPVRRALPSAATRAARRAVGRCRVDGASATAPEQLRALCLHLRAEIVVAGLAHRWAQVGAEVPAEWSLPRRAGLLADLAEQLERTEQMRRAALRLDDLLVARRIRGIQVGDLLFGAGPDRRGALAELQIAVGRRLAAHRATEAVDGLAGEWENRAAVPGAAPETARAARAVRDRDPVAYRRLYGDRADRRRARERRDRCAHLLGLLRAAHPVLARALSSDPDDPVWRTRLTRLPRAWGWARAREFFESQREEGLEESLDRELGTVERQVERLTADLACERAWQHCLERMTARQVAALRSYQAALDARGRGQGKHAARFAAAARDAMLDARDAVPAWIMPLPDVLSTVPAARESFDVVIVDEASQVGLESLFLLWLAPKVIVVGDDRQCTPPETALGALGPIFSRLDELLGDLPAWLRVAFTPRSSLFSVLRTRSGQVVRLREHFRCMPEIIEWSSRMFYRDEPLVPLRCFGTARLDPLRAVHVPGAYTEGHGTTLRNQVEAEALVERVLACSRDPAYEGLTFGVIVLQGTAQADLIRNALLRRLPRTEQEHRRLRVGTPPDFQGDERHVVFLSMVIAPGTRTTSLTRLEYRRRFNVAASRAQDQVWLFHSVTADSLNPADLRHSYLSHLLNRPLAGPGPRGSQVLPDVPCEPFDSLFEQRVYLDVRARGYHVTPQVESNGRRIDLVVTGERGRLAVECDGDAWHSTPEQLESDLVRERQLRRAGWEIWRVRASEYAFDRQAALAPLWKLLTRMQIHPCRQGPGNAPADTPEDPTAQLPASDGAPGTPDPPPDPGPPTDREDPLRGPFSRGAAHTIRFVG